MSGILLFIIKSSDSISYFGCSLTKMLKYSHCITHKGILEGYIFCIENSIKTKEAKYPGCMNCFLDFKELRCLYLLFCCLNVHTVTQLIL